MTYADRIRHPDGALNPPKKSSRLGWLWLLIGTALILILVFRPQWLKGIDAKLSGGASGPLGGGIANPHGWVG